MKLFFEELFRNHILIATLSAWAIAQSIKVGLGIVREKRFNFRWLVGTGGMPSAHTAGAAAMATSTGLNHGFDSGIFALTAMFAIIIMFDAQGVRRSAGKQAEILNKIMDDIYWRGKIEEGKLKELLGHTPIEVFAGALLGIFIAMIFYRP